MGDRTGRALASIFIAMLAGGGAMAAEPAKGDEAILFVWYPTAECPDKKEGPGATPATAIKIEDFRELYYEVMDGIRDDNEKKAEVPAETKYECRWVTLSGFFKWTDYYHYRGNLYADLPAAYFGGPSGLRYIIESFQDPAERRARVNGARVTLTGRFYDLCRRAAMEVPSDATLIFGPCHYGDLKGLMLRDVIVGKIEAGPNLRIKGEVNRGVIGNLVSGPAKWREEARVKAAFFDWVGALRSGREAYWKTAVERMTFVKEEEKPQRVADALEDREDWVSHLIDSAESPLKKQSDAALKRRPFRVFQRVTPPDADYLDDEGGDDPSEVVACVCLTRDCDDEWPLFESDALRFSDKYICNEMSKGIWSADDRWEWWP